MARISGVDLPAKKRIECGLTYIYGIGHNAACDILKKTGINPDIRCENLDESDIAKIRDCINESYKIEGDLRREVSLNIKRLVEIGSYRGSRHTRGLPVRGQNTKNNSHTRKGPKKTVANKKKADAKK
ncbi:MAG: 30S ribosomal protein S13 [Oscillospiraceae bacterium]|jgi:small subunit ribosomal protein S13|nr:30S ribosomal protein S13 [Oscillospiraceae bacterium]